MKYSSGVGEFIISDIGQLDTHKLIFASNLFKKINTVMTN